MVAGMDAGQVAERLAHVRSRIADAGGTDVAVLAVTKGFGPDAVAAARSVGLEDLGENYAQELLAKAEAAAEPPPRWHAIGRLQRNKVRQLAPHVWCWQSVDRPELAAEIARRAPGARVLVQVAAWGELRKGGAAPAAVPADDLGLVECSMGMSDDLAEAVAEGSTMVRVGRGLFGPRSSAPAVGN